MRNTRPSRAVTASSTMKEARMKGIFLWLVGVPIPVILLLYACGALHH